MKLKGYLLGIISASCYGLIPLFILPVKAVYFPLEVLLFLRFLLAAAMILAYLLIRGESLRVSGREFLVLVVLGLLYALSTDSLFYAYDLLTPGIASTILFVYPVFVAVIMNMVYNEPANRATVLSLVIVLAGVVALGWQQSLSAINIPGLSIALFSALLYAVYMVTVNQSRIRVSGIKLSFFSLFFSSMYFLVKSLLFGHSVSWPGMMVFGNLLWLSLVCTVLTITTLIYAIRYIGSTAASILGALEPIVAVGISVMLFGEQMTVSLAIGIILVLAGVLVNVTWGSSQEISDTTLEKQQEPEALHTDDHV